MPYRRLKIYDAAGRMLYESIDQDEPIDVAFSKAEEFGIPVGCRAERLYSSKWEMAWEWIVIVVGISAGILALVAVIVFFTHLLLRLL